MRLTFCVLLGLIALASATTGGEYVDNEGTEIDASNDDLAHNMNAEDLDNAPFVPTMSETDDMEEASEVAVDNEEASDQEETMISDEESDEADELEGNGEFSFLEASADAETDAEGKPKKPAKIVPKAKAPAPIKAAPKPFKFHSERIEAATNKFEDPEMAKLNLALEAVKEDILSTNKQITDERKWVIAVAKIIASYNDKMKRVESHIIALRKEMKALYRKKKQIENLKLQKALEAKLKEARDELATLTHSLKHVAVKQGELNRSGSDLRQTIAGIQAQLAKLRGQQLRSPRPAPRRRRRCKKGLRYSKKAKKCVPRKARIARKAAKKL
jgi:septal ring factor EnvC (AmiA/AmiB activator)